MNPELEEVRAQLAAAKAALRKHYASKPMNPVTRASAARMIFWVYERDRITQELNNLQYKFLKAIGCDPDQPRSEIGDIQ